VTVRAQVVSLHDGDFLYKVGPAANLATTLGPTAVLRVGAVRVQCASHAVYEHTDVHYAACGIDINQCRLVSFKNLMNFRKLLSDTTDFIALDGPGATPLRLQDVEWRNRKRPFWPADDKTIVIKLTRPFGPVLEAIGKPLSRPAMIMPERLATTDPQTQITEMVGSAPFRFLADEYVSGAGGIRKIRRLPGAGRGRRMDIRRQAGQF
tara:strand:+ start:530 stop:1153 length:624 start_codon:yes stop_codon:yes gene_type:complete